VPATLHIKTPPSGWGGGAWIAQNSLGFHFTPEQLPARLWRIVGLEITNCRKACIIVILEIFVPIASVPLGMASISTGVTDGARRNRPTPPRTCSGSANDPMLSTIAVVAKILSNGASGWPPDCRA
jgi:hypothetical protein